MLCRYPIVARAWPRKSAREQTYIAYTAMLRLRDDKPYFIQRLGQKNLTAT